MYLPPLPEPWNSARRRADAASRGMYVIMADVSLISNETTLDPDRELEEEKKPGASEPPRIRCPLSGWSPRKEKKWFCTCGNEWNTFDTGGVCPACLHQWTETQVSLVQSMVAALALVCGTVGLIRAVGLWEPQVGSRCHNVARV